MAFNLTNGLSDRIKRLRTWLPGNSSKPRREAGSLLKLNLPPLMGRRDAAYDCAVALLLTPMVQPADKSAMMAEWFRRAMRDTEAIFWKLSNRDTELRERTVLALISKLLRMAEQLESFGALGDQLNYEQQTDAADIRMRPDAKSFNRMVSELCDCEDKVLLAMKRLCERTQPRLNRYRAYAAQNFSSSNAERYRKAYETNLAFFAEENPTISSYIRSSLKMGSQN